jgi:FKBP-type peptidyl-prolyl cis-trans isomerase
MFKHALVFLALSAAIAQASDDQLPLTKDALIGSDYAEQLLNSLSDEQITEVDFEAIAAGFRKTLLNKQVLLKRETLLKEKDAETTTRQMAEIYHLKSNRLFPFYQHSDRGYYYLKIQSPKSKDATRAELNDTVTIKLSAETHEGIPYYKDPEPITRKITAFPKSLGLSMVGMREGEIWQIILPSWSMFGGNAYMEIPAYSTIVADVEMITVEKDEEGSTQSQQEPPAE